MSDEMLIDRMAMLQAEITLMPIKMMHQAIYNGLECYREVLKSKYSSVPVTERGEI